MGRQKRQRRTGQEGRVYLPAEGRRQGFFGHGNRGQVTIYGNFMRKSYIILILVLLSGLVIPAHCDFDYIGAGARPAGMGNCYTAFSDDAYGIYYNPGGVSFARSMELSTDFGQLWTNLTDGSSLSNGYLGCVYPKGKHAFGLAIQRFSLSGYYSENTVALSYSKKITDTLGLGLNLKQ